jgi:hypothetical protein
MKTKQTLKSRFVKWLTGLSLENLKENQNIVNDLLIISPNEDSGLRDNYLFDFKNYSSQYNGNISSIAIDGTSTDPTKDDGEENPNFPKKIKVKPIDVLNELETIPTPFTLTLIDEKIEILKDKSKLIVQHYAKREVVALIERLENRKKYLQYRSFFDKYQNTTDEKIDVLLEKYELVMKTSDIFVPEFPDDAIQTMKDYTEAMLLICDKKPVFYVIAEVNDFRKAYEKRDPILLAQSPFGFYWQILGAWDKEMLLLSEL